jgi:polynucleotide 5'-hydroxyl-kinase GRC3/NOL9
MLTFNSYESPTRIPADAENFTLSKTRLNLNDVVYSDEQTLCVRIKEKMVRFATTF